MPTPLGQQWWPDPATDTRTRVWSAALSAPGAPVMVRKVAVLAPGEDLTEYPETWELTWDEWVASCTSSYGLTVDGAPVADRTADRQAWRRLRRVAAGTDPIDASAFTALLRVLRGIAREVNDDGSVAGASGKAA